MSSLYISEVNSLSDTLFTNIFYRSVGCLLTLLFTLPHSRFCFCYCLIVFRQHKKKYTLQILLTGNIHIFNSTIAEAYNDVLDMLRCLYYCWRKMTSILVYFFYVSPLFLPVFYLKFFSCTYSCARCSTCIMSLIPHIMWGTNYSILQMKQAQGD